MNREHHILDAAGHALRRTTGLEGVATNRETTPVFELTANNRKRRFRAEIKTADRFEVPALLKARETKYREPTLLVAPYITREVAERCRELRLPFIDTAGNAYLEAPGLFIYVTGNNKPVELRREQFRALTPAGLQVAFAVACTPKLLDATYREIAAHAGVALGTVGPVMKDLETRGYPRAPERMIEEWVTHYPVTLRPRLNPGRFQADPHHLQQLDLVRHNAYWGGEPAAERLTKYLKPAQYTIYAREPIAKLIAAGRMRAEPTGNVEILDAFWHFDRDNLFPDVVPALLAYADLLATRDGRNAEAAKLIYEQRIAPAFR